MTNLHALLALLVAGGPRVAVTLLDAGPTFGETKAGLGLRLLPFSDTLRRACR